MLPDGTRTVRIEAASIDGPMVGKFLSAEKFERSLPGGVSLADFALATDLAGTPQLGWWGDWRAPALGDMVLRPDPATGVVEPGAGDTVGFLGSFTEVARTRAILPRPGRWSTRRSRSPRSRAERGHRSSSSGGRSSPSTRETSPRWAARARRSTTRP
jgi:hypothetical protein